MKNLPIGLQNLAEIIEANSIYVDKTQLIHQLVTTGKYYFLSRPRRFGKSLTVSVLKELFEGNKPLFSGLWIENEWDWSKKNPVIHISFAQWDHQGEGLTAALLEALNKNATSKGITLTKKTPKSQFNELIEAVYKQAGSVVILIDEYDKPILDYMEDNHLKTALANRKLLKNFYSVLKDSGKIMRFLFLTGVSKFAQVSIFSDLNHLEDISLDRAYAALTGYTQAELEFYFADHLTNTAQNFQVSPSKLLENIKLWYDGYTWDGKTHIYNPFGTLNFFKKQDFRNYWFSTGTPTFVLEQMKKYGQFTIQATEVDSLFFEKHDLEHIDVYPLLYQSGYLTIKSIRRTESFANKYFLDFPNKEVRESLFEFFMKELTHRSQRPYSGMTMQDLQDALERRNLPRVKVIINAYLAELPDQVFRNTSEGLYHGLVHIIFMYLGTMIHSEVHSAHGRADVVVQTDTDVFIFEFKLDESADAALQQVHEKGYAEKYRASGKTIIGIGVNFNAKKRAIDDWKTEVL